MFANTKAPESGMRARFSTLWVFMLLNYLYCDVLGLFDPTVPKDLTPDALLAAAVLMEIPIAMVVLSRVLDYRPNRLANILAGALMAAVQVATLFVGGTTTTYAFFSVIEIAALAIIVWSAWKWTGAERRAGIVASGRAVASGG